MTFRPRKGMNYSRRALGLMFLGCGILLATVHILAGCSFLLLAAVILYYAPRWDLRIEITSEAFHFSENVMETIPLVLPFADIAEIRRISDQEDRKGFLAMYSQFHPFVEFVTRAGKIHRMHDIFSEDLDDEIAKVAAQAGIKLDEFPREEA